MRSDAHSKTARSGTRRGHDAGRRGHLPVLALLAPFPAALLAAEALSGSLWRHASIFYGVMAVLLGLFVHGLVRVWRGGPRGRGAAVSIAIVLVVLSFLPMWFAHADNRPDGPRRHGHTLWELVHVH